MKFGECSTTKGQHTESGETNTDRVDTKIKGALHVNLAIEQNMTLNLFSLPLMTVNFKPQTKLGG